MRYARYSEGFVRIPVQLREWGMDDRVRRWLNDIEVGLISRGWQTIDGPPKAYFRARRRQGDDQTIEYQVWSYCGPMGHHLRVLPSIKDGDRIAEIFLDQLDMCTLNDGISPTKHLLVWRSRPEMERHDTDRWQLYCRFAFMLKDAWILEAHPDDRADEAASARSRGFT